MTNFSETGKGIKRKWKWKNSDLTIYSKEYNLKKKKKGIRCKEESVEGKA